MTFRLELDGSRVVEGRVDMPARGLWSARVRLPEPKEYSSGQAVTLAVGALSLAGSIVRGGTFADGADVLIRAGRSGWPKSTRPRSYRSNSVKLSNALRDLAAELGEKFRDGFGPDFVDRTVGYALVRPGGKRGSEALAQLIGERWYVDELGETVLGDRPSGLSQARALEYDAASRVVDLSAETDAIPMPGETVRIEEAEVVLERVVVSVDAETSVMGYVR